MSSEPEMSDAQFTNVFSIMIGGLILLTIGLIILAAVVASGTNQSNINQQVRDAQVVERIEPAGRLAVGDAATSTASAAGSAETTGAASGESVYQSSCAACHASGVAGAPALGDTATWSERNAKGKETLYDHAINGFQGDTGMMPAKGGNTSLSDEEVKAAVDYMMNATSGGGSGTTGSASGSTGESGSTSSASASGDAAEAADPAPASGDESGTTESAPASSDGSGTTAAAASGESVYQSGCAACHAAGVAGAPKLGDAAAWSGRLSKGTETLYDHAINGFEGETGVMLPKGGFTNLSDEEVKAAVDYMVEQVE